jgi:hypothetical protein
MGKLGQLLVARGWITVQQLTRALKNQGVVGGRLGTCLLEMDALGEEVLARALAEHLGVPAAGPDDLRGIPEEVLALVPEKLARRCRAVPFHVMGGRLDVAIMDPRNLACQDELAFACGKRVKVHVASELRVFEALERYYGEEMPSRLTLLLDRLNRARYLWEKPAEPDLSTAEMKAVSDLFARPAAAAAWPEPAISPPPRRASAPAPAAPAAAARPAVRPAASVPGAARAAAPAAAPRAVPRSVTLTPEERAELGLFGAVAAPEPPPPPPPPAPTAAPPRPKSLAAPAGNVEEIEQVFAAAEDRDEVGRILLGYLGPRGLGYRRAALFQVGKDRVSGWMAEGEDIEPRLFADFSIGFDQPSLFLNLRQGSGLHLGPMPPMPVHRQLARAWGGELPQDCVLLPVRVKDRLVAVVYADGAKQGLKGIDLSRLQRLTAATAAAFERFILDRKHGTTRP